MPYFMTFQIVWQNIISVGLNKSKYLYCSFVSLYVISYKMKVKLIWLNKQREECEICIEDKFGWKNIYEIIDDSDLYLKNLSI